MILLNIFNLLVTLMAAIVGAVVGLFPACSTGVVSYINSGFSLFSSLIANLQVLLPMDTILPVLGYMLVIEVAVLAWTATRWIASALTGRVK